MIDYYFTKERYGLQKSSTHNIVSAFDEELFNDEKITVYHAVSK